ncbi:MAG: DUF4178 domain-containing protein [Polaromonas sp.]
MATESAYRAYRTPCPGCGAPVAFLSAQSTHAVCGYCQSTVVRSGDVLARVGKMAELFDDFSPLQLQASGTYVQDGAARAFTLVGRLQYQYGEGVWTEWALVLDDGGTAFLSEDNGAYVFSLPGSTQQVLPAAERFRVGATTAISGKPFSVASNQQVSLKSAQGELPRLPALGVPFAMVELRSADGEVLSIDYGDAAQPAVSRGRAVLLDDLKLTGLKDGSATDEKGQQFDCPNCGAAVEVTLATSQSITCRACNSLIDLSQGVGGALAHAMQQEPIAPLIALGSTGQLQGTSWQVVGFQHRLGREPGDDEEFGWSEYLLYNAKRGFVFLVDAQDGWSLVKPVTGAPTHNPGSQNASYLGSDYRLLTTYTAETDYVAGEFYWRVVRGQKSQNQDFAKGPTVLSREQTGRAGAGTGGEVTWSSGSKLNGDTVAKAFKLDGNKALFQRTDATPLSGARSVGCGTVIIVVVVIVILLVLLSRCSSCDPNRENCSTRTSGGSFGGFSGGGGHK